VALIPDTVCALLAQLAGRFRQVLGENLVGIYLHGSLAMGCFNPRTSDVDFIVVVSRKLDAAARRAVIAFILELAEQAPPKGLEFSIVTLEAARRFVHPTPFELHYSKTWHEMYRSGQADYETPRLDPDLAAHFTIIRERGICLCGRPIGEVFGSVPEADYWASIRADAQDILDNPTRNPVYTVLNLCRVLAFKQERLITSKTEGGRWGLRALPPEYAGLIRQALDEYQAETPPDSPWDDRQLESFAAYMQELL